MRFFAFSGLDYEVTARDAGRMAGFDVGLPELN